MLSLGLGVGVGLGQGTFWEFRKVMDKRNDNTLNIAICEAMELIIYVLGRWDFWGDLQLNVWFPVLRPAHSSTSPGSPVTRAQISCRRQNPRLGFFVWTSTPNKEWVLKGFSNGNGRVLLSLTRSAGGRLLFRLRGILI